METKKVFSGLAASSGTVRGIVNIIRSPEEFKKFKSGDILVTPATGGMLSHASIVAREYVIPCVVNVQRSIAALKDGDLIEVAGTNVIVKII